MVVTQLADATVRTFGQRLQGELIRPTDASYDETRQIWNAMIDRRPGLIARCRTVADVQTAVDFAREHSLIVSVRGGGHNIAGNAVCDDGLMIDLAPMKAVRVDPAAQRATVEAGATLGDFDAAAQQHALATPLGINSTTGVAGLTLGGGFGWLSRKYGMTVDNLLAAEVVTADGKHVRASADEHADLFWALRGGGGNFGVVTSFEFQLYPVGPEVLAGLVVFPFDQAKAVLKRYNAFVPSMPDDLSVWMVTRKAPPLPFLPPDVPGKNVVIFAVFYAGAPAEGQTLVDQVRAFGTPVAEHVGPVPYVAWQQAFDPLLTPGARNYWKSHNFAQLSDGTIDTIVEYAGKLPSDQCEIFLGLIGAQTMRVAPDATAYAHRDAVYVMNVHGRWEAAAEDERCIAWAREFFEKSAPEATGGVYVNFLTEDEGDRVRAAFGINYDRLTAIKRAYDPNNLFRMNQNIKPA